MNLEEFIEALEAALADDTTSTARRIRAAIAAAKKAADERHEEDKELWNEHMNATHGWGG